MATLIENARQVLLAGPPLRLAVLFGSHAKGSSRPDSDVDIAIMPVDGSLSLGSELDLAAELSRTIGREIDLVRADNASTLLRWQIARDGVLLVGEPAWEWIRFQATVASEHAEIADALDRAARLFQRRITGVLTDPLIVLKKLAMLREHAARVRRRRPASKVTFESDVDLQDALALSFLVAVQETNDIAMHLAVDEGWGLPGSYAEAFDLLARNNVIGSEHARELGAVASVRNRIAHGYASVDPGRLWTELPAGLDALDRYVDAIARFVDQASS